jgi:hypothetical protein
MCEGKGSKAQRHKGAKVKGVRCKVVKAQGRGNEGEKGRRGEWEKRRKI